MACELSVSSCSLYVTSGKAQAFTLERHPPGVVLPLEPAMPESTERGAALGVIALREPIDAAQAADVVRAYVRAFEEEDLPAALQLLARDAAVLGRVSGRSQVAEVWKAKAKQAEARKLGASSVTRVIRLATYGYDALALAPGGPLKRPPAMRPGDLYTRVTLSPPRVVSDPVFGNILLLLLRREDGQVRIAGQGDVSEDEVPQ